MIKFEKLDFDPNKGNEILAVFMAYQILIKKYQYLNYNSSNESYWERGEGEIVCDEHGNELSDGDSDPYYSFEDLPFDSSWDWLMPIVGKISSLCEEPEELDTLKYALLSNDINAAWKECVNWISEYQILTKN